MNLAEKRVHVYVNLAEKAIIAGYWDDKGGFLYDNELKQMKLMCHRQMNLSASVTELGWTTYCSFLLSPKVTSDVNMIDDVVDTLTDVASIRSVLIIRILPCGKCSVSDWRSDLFTPCNAVSNVQLANARTRYPNGCRGGGSKREWNRKHSFSERMSGSEKGSCGWTRPHGNQSSLSLTPVLL